MVRLYRPVGHVIFTLWLMALMAHAEDALTPVRQNGICAFRGKSRLSKGPPFVDNTPAAPLPFPSALALAEVCGAQYDGQAVCCDASQVESLRSNLLMLKAIVAPSCPACFASLARITCAFTCDGNQSRYVNITETLPVHDDNAGSTKETVRAAIIYTDSESMDGAFQSCARTTSTSLNGNLLQKLFGATTADALFHALGHYEDSPMVLDFVRETPSNTSMGNLKIDYIPCDTHDPTYQCAAPQCHAYRGALTDLDDHACRIGLLSCYEFTLILLYTLLTLAFLVYRFRSTPFVLRQLHSLRSQPILLRGSSLFPSRFSRRIALEEEEEEPIASERDGDEPSALPQESYHPSLQMLYPLKMPSVPIRSSAIHHGLQSFFYELGLGCATHPKRVILICLAAIGVLSLGLLRFDIETDPLKLWVSPTSNSLAQKNYFDRHFGPFYRVSQVFVTSTASDGNVLAPSILRRLASMQEDIRLLAGSSLEDICFKPLESTNEPGRQACAVPSILAWFPYTDASGHEWQLKDASDEAIQKRIKDCTLQPMSCLPAFRQPLNAEEMLSGYQPQAHSATTLVITYVINNHLKKEENVQAVRWEKAFLNYMHQAQLDNTLPIRFAYSTESSIEAEINVESKTNVFTILISYLVMFLYASLALGDFHSHHVIDWFVHSNILLALSGIFTVLASVLVSVAVFSLLGVRTTLIIAEVIPFLALAIGVDNIFILLHALHGIKLVYYQQEPQAPPLAIAEQVALMLSQAGPSIVMSTLAEVIAFSIGGFVSMPAIATFAAYAALAILVSFLLQMTFFVACITLNAHRERAGRLDLFPFWKLKRQTLVYTVREGTMAMLNRRYYASNILKPKVKPVILLCFAILFAAATFLAPRVAIGLDQRLALPRTSYLVSYFDTLGTSLNIGPPVYFVVRNMPFEQVEVQAKLCGRHIGCGETNLPSLLTAEAARPEKSYLTGAPDGWLDDFFSFIQYQPGGACCWIDEKGEMVSEDAWDNEDWTPCSNTTVFRDISHMAHDEHFATPFRFWKQTPLREGECLLGGLPLYEHSLSTRGPRDLGPLDSFTMRTAHTPLRTQSDFIGAYRSALKISATMQASLGGEAEVFPYSVFYVFFEQYLTIWGTTLFLLALALLAVTVITAIFLGSIVNALLITLTTTMILVDMLAVMALWDISLNGVSLVNLLIAVGISVEFCSHITKAYAVAPVSGQNEMTPTFAGGVSLSSFTPRDRRVFDALVKVGTSIFSGMMLTKLLGILVLAFSPSKIFEVFYFRMYLAIVLLGCLHGLLFLPVLLTYFGSSWVMKTSTIQTKAQAWPFDQRATESPEHDMVDEVSDDDEEETSLLRSAPQFRDE